MEIYDYQIIANLTSGDGKIEKKLEEVKLFLENHQLSYRLIKIESYFPIDDIFEKEKFVIKKGVICLGGDGTVSSAISYMLNNQIEAPIGIVPVGTANFIASYLKLDCDSRNFDCFLKERVKFFDVGVAEFGKHREYFVLGLGLGFERDLLHLPQKLKKKAGIFSYIFFQSIENIGMNLGLFPITGVTLPLFSYGGSSLLSTMISLGILENIAAKSSKRNFFQIR